MTTAKRLSTHQATELAGDLLHALAQHAGDGEAIGQIMRHWHQVLGAPRFGVICMASVRIAFRDRLAPTADVPPGTLLVFKQEGEEHVYDSER